MNVEQPFEPSKPTTTLADIMEGHCVHDGCQAICTVCHQKNRVQLSKHRQARCGACGGHLWMDYYTVLNVNVNASLAELKRAFRMLAALYHPDVASDKGVANQCFPLILSAYETLSEPLQRSSYDRTREHMMQTSDKSASHVHHSTTSNQSQGPQDGTVNAKEPANALPQHGLTFEVIRFSVSLALTVAVLVFGFTKPSLTTTVCLYILVPMFLGISVQFIYFLWSGKPFKLIRRGN